MRVIIKISFGSRIKLIKYYNNFNDVFKKGCGSYRNIKKVKKGTTMFLALLLTLLLLPNAGTNVQAKSLLQ